jgi:hypothetical protein
MGIRKTGVILAHALAIWAFCGMVMGVLLTVTTPINAAAIHDVAALIFAVFAARFYFKKFAYTAPLLTAVLFALIIAAMDIFVVSMLIMGSFDMFKGVAGLVGTWAFFVLMPLAVWLTGVSIKKRTLSQQAVR